MYTLAEVHLELSQLIKDMPEPRRRDAGLEMARWCGRVSGLLEQNVTNSMHTGSDAIIFSVASTGNISLNDYYKMLSIVHRELARVERLLPSDAKGAFIGAGESFTAAKRVSEILAQASATVMVVDPYAGRELLFDFAILAPEGLGIRILADKKSAKPELPSLLRRWDDQYSPSRPLKVRLAPKGSLHDRLILVDESSVFTVGQSFNALATRSATTIARVDDEETRQLKIAHYLQAWNVAQPLASA